ncbi:MAG: type II secretion system protein N [Limnohabitans sp.]
MKTRTAHHTPTPGSAWRWTLGGALLGCVLAALSWAPARWLAWGVAQASQGQVQWQNPRGTVWEGSAQLTLSGGAGSRDTQTLPGRLHWRILPGVLSWRTTLLADCCMDRPIEAQLQAGLSTLSLQLSDHPSRWPAAWLSGLGAPWNTLQAEGQLQLRTESLRLQWTAGRLHMQGLVELQAQDMSSRLSPLKPMGSYRLQIRGAPQGTATPELQLSTLQGPLQLQGQGLWVGSRLRFSGEARAEAGSEAALSNLLNIIGRRQGDRSLLSLG